MENIKEKNKTIYWLTGTILALLVIVGALLVYSGVNKKVIKYNLNMITEMSEHDRISLKNTLNVRFNVLFTASDKLSEEIGPDTDNIPALLADELRYMTGAVSLVLIDDEGGFIRSEGSDLPYDDFLSRCPTVDGPYSYHYTAISMETPDMLVLGTTAPIDAGDRHFTHLCVLIDSRVLKEDLIISCYNGEGFSSIIDYNGNYIASRNDGSGIFSGDNIMEDLSTAEIKGYASVEEFLNSIEETDEITYADYDQDGRTWRMVVSPLRQAGWIFLTTVPLSVFDRLSREVVVIFYYLFAFMILICVCVALLLLRTKKQQSELAFAKERAKQNEALENAFEMADSASRAKTEFLFNMSHDIRTPMNALLGFTRIARNHIDDKERVKDCLEKINVSGKQLLDLINEVLEMGRIESGRMEIKEVGSNMEQCLDTVNPMFAETAKAKGIDYETSIHDIANPNVWVDRYHVNRILTNLVSNAIKYTEEGGKVSIDVFEEESSKNGYSTYVFRVSDTGIGMSEEFQKRVFDEFSREENRGDKEEGSGLGLSIAKRIAEQMGGRITVESQKYTGSAFTLKLLLRIMTEEEIREQEKAKDTQEEEELENRRIAGILKNRKVLLVEDNDLNREIAHDILESQGLKVTEAEDGAVAYEMMRRIAEKGVREDYFDFILMDIQMPVMDGYESTRAIRSIDDPFHVHLPIIAMTANAFAEDRQRAYECGMDAHLSKPIDVGLLKETLAAFIEK